MNEDIQRFCEETVPLSEVPNIAEMVTGKRPAPRTVRYWTTRGARGKKLRAMCICGKFYTTLSWLREFWDLGEDPPKPTSPVFIVAPTPQQLQETGA